MVASFTHVASSSPPYWGHHDGATMRTTDPTHGVDDKAAGAMPPAVNTPAASAMPLNMGHPGARDPSCRPPLPDSDESASLATACELLHDTFVKWECTLGSRCLWSLMVAAGAMDVRMVHVATQRGVASQYCATMMENCAVFATGKKTAAGHDDRALEAEIGGTMAPPSSGDVVSTWSDQTTPPLLPAAPTLPSGGNFSTQRPTAPSVPLSSHQADRIMTPPLHSSTGGSDQSTLSLPHRASTWTCPLSSSSSSSLLLPSPSTARWTQLPPPTTPATISDAAQPFLIYYRQGSWRQWTCRVAAKGEDEEEGEKGDGVLAVNVSVAREVRNDIFRFILREWRRMITTTHRGSRDEMSSAIGASSLAATSADGSGSATAAARSLRAEFCYLFSAALKVQSLVDAMTWTTTATPATLKRPPPANASHSTSVRLSAAPNWLLPFSDDRAALLQPAMVSSLERGRRVSFASGAAYVRFALAWTVSRLPLLCLRSLPPPFYLTNFAAISLQRQSTSDARSSMTELAGHIHGAAARENDIAKDRSSRPSLMTLQLLWRSTDAPGLADDAIADVVGLDLWPPRGDHHDDDDDGPPVPRLRLRRRDYGATSSQGDAPLSFDSGPAISSTTLIRPAVPPGCRPIHIVCGGAPNLSTEWSYDVLASDGTVLRCVHRDDAHHSRPGGPYPPGDAPSKPVPPSSQRSSSSTQLPGAHASAAAAVVLMPGMIPMACDLGQGAYHEGLALQTLFGLVACLRQQHHSPSLPPQTHAAKRDYADARRPCASPLVVAAHLAAYATLCGAALAPPPTANISGIWQQRAAAGELLAATAQPGSFSPSALALSEITFAALCATTQAAVSVLRQQTSAVDPLRQHSRRDATSFLAMENSKSFVDTPPSSPTAGVSRGGSPIIFSPNISSSDVSHMMALVGYYLCAAVRPAVAVATVLSELVLPFLHAASPSCCAVDGSSAVRALRQFDAGVLAHPTIPARLPPDAWDVVGVWKRIVPSGSASQGNLSPESCKTAGGRSLSNSKRTRGSSEVMGGGSADVDLNELRRHLRDVTRQVGPHTLGSSDSDGVAAQTEWAASLWSVLQLCAHTLP